MLTKSALEGIENKAAGADRNDDDDDFGYSSRDR